MVTLATRFHDRVEDLLDNERVQKIRSYLPPLNFITIHYAYFIIVCLVASVIFWGSSNPSRSIGYTDSLFLVVSAMTEAGLNTVNLSQMTTFQQIILWLLIVIGSSIFVSISTVLTRKRVFEQRFEHVVKLQKEARRTHRRSMSMPANRNTALNARKPKDPADKSGFESRHSEPRDPVSAPSAAEQVAKPSDPSVPPLRRGSGDSASTANENATAIDDVGMAHDPDHISFQRNEASPGGSAHGRGRVLSFVDAQPKSSGFQSTSSPTGESIYNRGRRKDEETTEPVEELDQNE